MPASMISPAELAQAQAYLQALRDLVVNGGQGADVFDPLAPAALFDAAPGAPTRVAAYAMLRALLPVDPWHDVGAVNEPGFSGAGGPWANFGAGYEVASFRRFPDGTVEVRGLVSGGIAGPVFVLPPGYRPRRQLLFAVITDPNAVARVDVLPNGQVYAAAGCSAVWTSLSGVRFFADQ
jgi:hypothetical protein